MLIEQVLYSFPKSLSLFSILRLPGTSLPGILFSEKCVILDHFLRKPYISPIVVLFTCHNIKFLSRNVQDNLELGGGGGGGVVVLHSEPSCSVDFTIELINAARPQDIHKLFLDIILELNSNHCYCNNDV